MAIQNSKKHTFYIIFLLLLNISFASENPKQVSNAVEPVNFVEISSKMKSILDDKHRIHLLSPGTLNELNLLYSQGFSSLNELLIKAIKEKRVMKVAQFNYINKMQLVRTYGSIYKDNYDLIWFFDKFSKYRDLKDSILTLARKIRELEGSKIESHDDPKKAIMSYLQNHSRWLLVFDKICKKDFAYDDIEPFIKNQGNGHIIINHECRSDDSYTSLFKLVFTNIFMAVLILFTGAFWLVWMLTLSEKQKEVVLKISPGRYKLFAIVCLIICLILSATLFDVLVYLSYCL